MKNILEELWYGNINPNMECRISTQASKQLMTRVANYYEELRKILTKEQNEALERFNDCYAELTGINERDIFVYAFKLGARTAIEVMFNEEK